MKFISLLLTVLAVSMSADAAPFEKRIEVADSRVYDCSISISNIATRFSLISMDTSLKTGPMDFNKEMATIVNDASDANSKCCAFSTILVADANALAVSIVQYGVQITTGLNYLTLAKPANYPLGSAVMVSQLDEFNRGMTGINACFLRTLPPAPKAQLDNVFRNINTAYNHAKSAYLT